MIKNKILPAIAAISIILLLVYPGQCIEAARDALDMWFFSVVPSLLPFFILSSLLVGRMAPKAAAREGSLFRRLFGVPGSAGYAIFTGMVSGYPAGARMTADMLRARLLSPGDAVRILPYTLCASPTFLIGTVCAALLNAPELAPVMAAAHFGGAVLCGLFFRFWYGIFKPRVGAETEVRQAQADAADLFSATERAMQSMLFIGGTMVLFSIFIRQIELVGLLGPLSAAFQPLLSLLGLDPGMGVSAVEGVIEMANGCGEVAKTALPAAQQGAVALLIVSFGSLSVAAQSAGMLKGTPIKLRHYLFPKVVHAALAYMLYILLLPLAQPIAASVFWGPYMQWLRTADVPAVALMFSICGTVCYIVVLILVYNRRIRSNKRP